MRKKSGFTLVELIVTIALLGILMVPIGKSILTSVRVFRDNEKRVKISTFSDGVIQYYKSMGQNTIMSQYGIFNTTETLGKKYGYFNNMDELIALLDNSASMESNKNYSDMIVGTTDKKYGAYIEVSKSIEVGSNLANMAENITVDTMLKVVKVYVKVVEIKDCDIIKSEMIYYKGR